MGMDRDFLEVDFGEVEEFTNFFAMKISNYKDEVDNVTAILDSYESLVDSNDAEGFQLNGYNKNLKSFSNVLSEKHDAILKVSPILSGYLRDSLDLYIKTFLDRSMIYDVWKDPTKESYEGASVKDIFKPKLLKMSYKDGEIVTGMTEEDIQNLMDEMDKKSVKVKMDYETFMKLIEDGGLVNNDMLTDFTLGGAQFDAVKQAFEAQGIKLEVLQNGEINITGTSSAINSVFGNKINVTSPSDLFKGMMGKTAKDALNSLTFKGEGGVSKVNSALLWLNYLNNIDDAYINYKITGDMLNTGVGLVTDVATTSCSVVIGGMATGAVVAALSIGPGGAVIVAVVVGGTVAYIFNKFGGLIKEVVIDGIDSLEDTMLNLSDISTNY